MAEFVFLFLSNHTSYPLCPTHPSLNIIFLSPVLLESISATFLLLKKTMLLLLLLFRSPFHTFLFDLALGKFLAASSSCFPTGIEMRWIDSVIKSLVGVLSSFKFRILNFPAKLPAVCSLFCFVCSKTKQDEWSGDEMRRKTS